MTSSDSAPRALPLVMAEPRGRAKPPRHLADLSLDERTAYAAELGLPAFRAKQVSTHYFDRLVDDPAEMTDLPAAQRDEIVVGVPADADDADPHARGRPRHDPEDPVAAVRRRPRRVGADALPRPGDDVRLVAGRLRHGVPVLRHRPGRSPAQHVHRRDRRAGRRRGAVAGAGRGARRSRRGSPTSCSWAWASRWPTTRP